MGNIFYFKSTRVYQRTVGAVQRRVGAWRDWAVDRYLTWRTGDTKEQRDWHTWKEQNVVRQADTIENMFMHFKYIIPVSMNIFDDDDGMFGCIPTTDFKQYLYPQRALGDNAVYTFERGYRDQWDGRFHICSMGGDCGQLFVATNNSQDAMMIALKFS